MEKSKIVHWERQGEIGFLSISNGRENYLNTPDFVDINDLKKWTSEEGLKGIIITGLGRNFSAGANLDQLHELAADEKLLHEKMNRGKEILDFIEDLDIPVIASINGICFGGGLEIALACHLRVASPKALFAFPETNHGLIPGLGGTHRLTQLMGKKAFELILNGTMQDAQLAKDTGLIDYLSDDKNSLEYSTEFLKSMIEDRPVEVIKSVMQAIKNSTKMSKDEALKAETELFCKLAVNVNAHQED